MLPTITAGDASVETRTLYWQHENHAAIREGNWKLVTSNDRDDDAWELYDLSEDRSESNDMNSEHPDIVRRLKTKWRRWAERANVLPYPEQRDGAKPVPWPPRPWSS